MPLLVAVACQAAYTVAAQHRALIGGLEDKARSTAALLANVVGPSVALDDPKGVEDGLAYIVDDPDLLFSAAVDVHGHVTARGPDAAGASKISMVDEPLVVLDADRVLALFPLHSGAGNLGSVALAFTTAHVRAESTAITVRVILIASVGMALAVLVVLLLANTIVQKNRDLKLILDNADQGFLNVSRAGVLLDEHSAVVETWFGPFPRRGTLWSYLGTRAPDAAGWIELLWENVSGDALPLDMALEQIPRRIAVDGRILELVCKPIFDGERLLQILVIVSDVTVKLEEERARQGQRELISIVQRLLEDRAGILGFFADADGIVERLAGLGALPSPSPRRDLHTLKGNCSAFGIESVAELCQEIETRLAEGHGELSENDRQLIRNAWQRVLGWRELFYLDRNERIEIEPGDHRALLAAIARGESRELLAQRVMGFLREPLKQRLHRFGEQARALARRLGRGEIDVSIEAADVRLGENALGPFWTTFAHVIRNAVDHGLETAEERLAAGKTAAGRLDLRARVDADRLVVEIEDDGPGIDWDKIASRARAAGLPADSEDDLRAALFAPGLTTKEVATETSGRGIGMEAVRAACQATGGDIDISSERGAGTRLRFSWPASVLRTGSEEPALSYARSECA